ncbi:MAG: ribonuclease PH [Candidatus Omnitrophica bacterium]|nr:ribonuclease PH [Candidatus Omnitrophota bacterium]
MIKRSDGRKPDQLRNINIKRKFLKYAEGSCLIEMGNTRIICAASVDKKVPFFLKNTGEGWLTAEYRMLPCSSEDRIQRDKISGRTMEIQRLIGRSLRSVVNLKRLGERTIRIDCDVIQADGGTRTASIVGGYIALVDCLNKLYNRKEIFELCITDLLAATSVGTWQGAHFLDLTYLEDSQADVDMNVVMKGSGEFIEVQGTAEKGSFSEKDLSSFLKLAKKGIEEIINLEKDLFKDILAKL